MSQHIGTGGWSLDLVSRDVCRIPPLAAVCLGLAACGADGAASCVATETAEVCMVDRNGVKNVRASGLEPGSDVTLTSIDNDDFDPIVVTADDEGAVEPPDDGGLLYVFGGVTVTFGVDAIDGSGASFAGELDVEF